MAGGLPGTRGYVDSIEANLEFARRYVDWPYIQHPTPYPRTPMTKEFRDRGLIVDEDVAHYDGTTAVVRTEHVAASDVEGDGGGMTDAHANAIGYYLTSIPGIENPGDGGTFPMKVCGAMDAGRDH